MQKRKIQNGINETQVKYQKRKNQGDDRLSLSQNQKKKLLNYKKQLTQIRKLEESQI